MGCCGPGDKALPYVLLWSTVNIRVVENKSYSGGKAVTQRCGGGGVRFAPQTTAASCTTCRTIFPCNLESGIIWGIKALWSVQKINGYL